MKVVATTGYDRRARKLLTALERQTAELEIALAPDAWPVISGTGGARKARVSRGVKGKSGGARIIYYVWLGEDALYLLDIYAKNEKENLTHAEKNAISKFLEGLG